MSAEAFTSPLSNSDIPRTYLIGTGRVGHSLAWAMHQTNWPLEAIFGRNSPKDFPLPVQRMSHLPPIAERCLWLLCVPDDQIMEVAQELAAHNSYWSKAVVAHMSGLHTASALDVLRAKGASVMSFHPLQTFVAQAPAERFSGIYVVMEGDQIALALGGQLARHLGAQPHQISSAAKPAYHLAASIASNFLVTLMGISREVLAKIGFSEPDARVLMQALVDGTITNLRNLPAGEALTGPIVRGDVHTVAQHLVVLKSELSGLKPFYQLMAAETTRLAVQSERLSVEKAQFILEQILSETTS
ncbi:MAG: DUF2520 domain-containing protein [Bacteroidetes Order II. Incertae sedis bacterium]|nr:DUF2520 domain-containing protein [Bacteroidetes Order II. bacterium]